MNIKKIIIAHSWTDVSVNIQTKKVAYGLSAKMDVWFFTQARVGSPVLNINGRLVVMEWPDKRPTKWKDLFFCIKQIRAIKPDAVIVHFGATKIIMLASWLMGVRNRIAWYHTLSTQTRLETKGYIRTWFNLFVRTLVYSLATKIVAPSKFGALDAVNNQHVPAKKVLTIENGLEDAAGRRENYDYLSSEICFLYIGRLNHSKGCDFIVKVFAKVISQYPGVVLKLVGSGEAKSELAKLAEQLGVQNNIVFEGYAQTYRGVFDYLQNACALVVPSRTDNFPTVVLEAFSCGVPVIGSVTGGIPEMIEEGVDGCLCESGNEEEWVKKISWLIDNPAARNKMAVGARETFEKRFAIAKHIENVERFLESL